MAEQIKLKIKFNDMDLSENGSDDDYRMKAALYIMENSDTGFYQWDESVARQLVDTVTILSSARVLVKLRCGAEIEERLDVE